MSLKAQGRNEIPIPNSDGKILLENWVEERATQSLDPKELQPGMTSKLQLVKNGHRGIFTNEVGDIENSETLDKFVDPPAFPYRTKGTRKEMLEYFYAEQTVKQLQDENRRKLQEKSDDWKQISSTTKTDFSREFDSRWPKPTADHDRVKELPVSFWTENKTRVTGMSQTKTWDSPFRKNDAFSTPIGERWDEPEPHEFENYPKM